MQFTRQSISPGDPVSATPVDDNFAALETILDANIDSDNLHAEAVRQANIYPKAVDTAQIADSAIEALQIATGAVGEDELASDAVTRMKIKSGEVIHDKLGDDSVDANNYVDGSVGLAALAANVVYASRRITKNDIASGQSQANIFSFTYDPSDDCYLVIGGYLNILGANAGATGFHCHAVVTDGTTPFPIMASAPDLHGWANIPLFGIYSLSAAGGSATYHVDVYADSGAISVTPTNWVSACTAFLLPR